jgi:hypothetical protein
LEWIQSDEGLFWVNGKPGAGKSTLMKYIHDIHDIKRMVASAKSERVVLISFFFHELGIGSEKTFAGLLHALLLQLLTHIPELYLRVLPRFHNLTMRSTYLSSNQSIWTEVELQAAFSDILKVTSVSAKILCLVDGLDECEDKNLRQARDFLLLLAASAISPGLRFKVLCASRPENAIELKFSSYSSLKIQDFTYWDVNTYVTQRLNELVCNLHPEDGAVNFSPNLISELVNDVVWKAEGVFIWARLVVAELIMAIEDGDNATELNRRLEQLPSELQELYARILSKISLQSRHQTFNFLQALVSFKHIPWGHSNLLEMVLAIQPSKEALTSPILSMDETDRVAACIRTKKVLQSKCRGFITVPILHDNWSREEVLFKFCTGYVSVHKTVQDYLITNGSMASVWSGISLDLLEDKYEQLVAYLFRVLKSTYDVQKALRPITRRSIPKNADVSPFIDAPQEPELTQRVRDILEQLLTVLQENEEDPESKPLAPIWLPAVEAHLKTLFNVVEWLETFYDITFASEYADFERYAEYPAISVWHSDLLSIAIDYGLYSYIEERLRRVDKLEKSGRPYLNYLISSWHFHPTSEKYLNLLRMLLSKGCDPNGVFNFGTTWEFVLMSFVRVRVWKQCHDKVLLLFLEFGADPNQQLIFPGYECSALHVILSKHGRPESAIGTVLLEFLKKGAYVNAIDSKGCSVIQKAQKNCPQLVDLLTRYEEATTTLVAQMRRLSKDPRHENGIFSELKLPLLTAIGMAEAG